MFIGIDLGSRSVKIVFMEKREIKEMRIYDTPLFYRDYVRREEREISVDYKKIGLSETDPLGIVATGYGRNAASVNGAGVIPEIKAHTIGALYQTGIRDFTLLDIGGQDTKAVFVKDGRIEDFMMNDRCAASSGRYLENMASILGVDIEKLGICFEDPVELNSTCAVFGESELIGKIAEGFSIPRLCAGVNMAILKRIIPMLNRYQSDKLVLAGGGSQIYALQVLLARQAGLAIVTLKYPQYNGAIGCALWAQEYAVS